MPQSKKPRKKRKPPTSHSARISSVPPAQDNPAAQATPFDPRTMERQMAHLARERFGDDLIDQVPEGVLEAEELVYAALDETDPRERVRLIRAALDMSRDCADAWVLLAQETAVTLEEEHDLYGEGIEAGRRALGENFDQAVGHFWGILETRGFMRALAGRAEVRMHLGLVDEALADAWEILRLNPSDNMGIRYRLIDWLLMVWRNDEAARLLGAPEYSDEASASWAWSRALLAIRGRDDLAPDLIREAAKVNPFVALYLRGLEPLPADDVEFIGVGDESEATVYVHSSLAAWQATPGAEYMLDLALPGEPFGRDR